MPGLFDWSATPSSNSTVDGINIAEGCPAGNMNGALRSTMALVRQSFSSTLANFLSGASPLGVSAGGTGATSAAGARSALGAQAALVSGTNIKTISGNSLLGAGSIDFKTVNGTSLIGSGDISTVQTIFPAGTKMLFIQSTAPTGWTKDTTHNNKALRIVSGVAGSGGTTAFTSVFASRSITIDNMPSHSHGVSDPGHAHQQRRDDNFGASPTAGGNPDGGYGTLEIGLTSPATTGISIQSAGSGTPMDFAVAYVDAIIATKN